MLERRSDDIPSLPIGGKLALPLQPIHSRSAVAELEVAVDEFRPDVLHVENLFPLISPAVITAAAARRLPVVQAVRNFRHVCMAGTYFRDGHQCFDCREAGNPGPGVVHGCYRGSRAQSTAMAASLVRHRSTWGLVGRFLPTSRYLAEHLEGAGIPGERIVVRPNFVADPGEPPTTPGSGFVFAGRLEEEKGLPILLEAWRLANEHVPGELTIAGAGPLQSVAAAAARELPRLRVVGHVERAAVDALISGASAVVAPAVWPEPFGRTVIEAFARGRPVVATAVGGQAELVDDEVGWSCLPTPESLAAALVEAAGDTARATRGVAARRRYLDRFTEEASLDALAGAYAAVIG